jgi:hypothetical protein
VAVFVDLEVPADELREKLYAGNLVLLTRLRSVSDFVEYTREQLTELFRPYDPEHAHEHIEPAQMARILGSWKPSFIHSDISKKLVCEITREVGLPAEYTHFDLPKPRTSFPVGHLTTGVAFAFPWHRDVWYSAPRQQINWWLPIYPAREDNSMSFDLPCFDKAVPNSSDTFDYYQNNAQRLTTAKQVTREEQARPGALGHKPIDDLVVLPAPGAVLLFSGAQLHTSIPNTSGRARYSVDFRTVDARDLVAGKGAPLVDALCTGTAIRDFRNVADGSSFDEELVARLFGPPPPGALLVFSREEAERSGQPALGNRVAEAVPARSPGRPGHHPIGVPACPGYAGIPALAGQAADRAGRLVPFAVRPRCATLTGRPRGRARTWPPPAGRARCPAGARRTTGRTAFRRAAWSSRCAPTPSPSAPRNGPAAA